MKTNAAVAIIGGGVVGASVAYHLRLLGYEDVTIIERGAQPGEGSTGRATGGYRAQFATSVNVQLSLLAREKLLAFEDETGVDPGYQQVGYLWLASTEAQLSALAAAQQIQKAEGLTEAILLSPAEIGAVNESISVDGVVGAAFCGTDGYIRPRDILRGYLTAAERMGAHIIWGAECTGLSVDRDGMATAVETSHGTLEVSAVVNAAGPWASQIASMAGVNLPVLPVRRQAAYTRPTAAISPLMPMSIFLDNGFHLRARDGRALLCWPNPEPPGEPAHLEVDDDWIATVKAMSDRHVPALRHESIDRPMCYAGLYEVSPDEHAIVGRSPHCGNMYFANGSSGHGVMHSPALGEIVADMIAGNSPRIDVSMLRPSRFDEGAAIKSVELI